ncbi:MULTISPECIES: CHASE domain-containing protein [Hyphomicrobiales]|uniref:CHASE domain-containing protein n=1 Tax=Hyphomicrobiales TaxID=356 RepID=UPI00036E8CAD|nr:MULTISPECIES: CHASE domain-containing protein [Phyllobacteriaceae]MCX8567658.1 CHASE domain-containing protein [Aminobacter sp. MET-1]
MRKYFPSLIFVGVALVSLTMAALVYLATVEAARIKFQSIADDALNRIEGRVEFDIALLRATQAMFAAQKGELSRDQFRAYFSSLDVSRNFTGLRGIGFLRFIERGHEADIARELKEGYGIDRMPFPDTDLEWRAPVVLFEPMSKTGLDAMGLDMAADPLRRPAIEAAMAANGEPRATGRVLLGQDEATRQPGILVFSRVARQDGDGSAPAGFLYVAFRTAELFQTALGRGPLLPVAAEVFDGTKGDDALLFRSEAPPDTNFSDDFLVTRETTVAGRKWVINFRPSSAFEPPSPRSGPLMLGLFGLVLAGSIALVARYQQRAYEAAAQLHETTEKSLLEKDLMLQEMKHRIKNSIARVLAMARQTAARAKDVDEFSSSFSARLQAMAASQDMLTRSRWQRANLGELLRIELGQVFGKELPEDMMKGPPVELDETTTQALGLTFHELATNALKYGEAANSMDVLKVEWALKPQGKETRLVLKWAERNGKGVVQPEKTGFGTRLIDMNITRELDGRIERHFGDDGLRVEIDIPYRH